MKNSDRLDAIEGRLGIINRELGELIGQQKTIIILVKWIVLPLILLIGALTGVELVFPF